MARLPDGMGPEAESPWTIVAEQHWREFRPVMVGYLESRKLLKKALRRAADEAGEMMFEMIEGGMDKYAARELAMREYLYLPTEEEEPMLSPDLAPFGQPQIDIESPTMTSTSSVDCATMENNNQRNHHQGSQETEEGKLDDRRESSHSPSEINPDDPEYGANNTIVTKEEAEKWSNELRELLSETRSETDPQEEGLDAVEKKLQEALSEDYSATHSRIQTYTQAVAYAAKMIAWYVEAGTRGFIPVSRIMVSSFGDSIKPYLANAYIMVKSWPGMGELEKEMDSYDAINEQFDRLDELLAAQEATSSDEIITRHEASQWKSIDGDEG